MYRNSDTVTWVNMVGVHEVEAVQAVCHALQIHPLWIEDIVNPHGRPKVDSLEGLVFVVARMMVPEGEKVRTEQISILLGPEWVLTFQEREGDVWEPLRERIRLGKGRIRSMGADYLLHALLDDVVDNYFICLELLETRVDHLEARAIDPEAAVDLGAVFSLKNELADFRRSAWPMRETMHGLLRLDSTLSVEVLPYYRDLSDHIVQVMDALEANRERVVGVYELHLAVTGHRLNDIMKVLTIVSTIFIPMTFVAGVYGMNFKNMPELEWTYGYPAAWVVMLGCALGGGVWVYGKRWLS
jgi:magnesium transporter